MTPIKVSGKWTEGYAIDRHVIHSEHIGYDQFGHDIYDTTRSELGELIYKMKYNGHLDTSEKIVNIITPFLDRWLADKNIDYIIPIPPTTPRESQPVFLIAKKIADRYGMIYNDTVLRKISSIASKDMRGEQKTIEGTITKSKKASSYRNILLIDDLYSTGSTANECVRVLKQDPYIDNVYFLAITKTR